MESALVVAEVAAHSLRTVHAGGSAIPLSAPSPQDQKERPLKLAERKTQPQYLYVPMLQVG